MVDFKSEDSIIKEGVIAALFITTLVAALLPWFLATKIKRAEFLFSVLNCLAGGVVVGAGFSHMLPSANDSFTTYLESTNAQPIIKNYPWAFLCSAFSMLVLLSIDRLLLSHHGHSHCEVKAIETEKPKESQRTEETVKVSIVVDSNYHDSAGSFSKCYNTLTETTTLLPANTQQQPQVEDHGAQAYIFLVALSIHSVFEGLGMGAEQSPSGVYNVLIAVVAHKWLEAFALGLAILAAKFSRTKIAVLLIGYSLATPIGIFIGLCVGDLRNEANLLCGILVSLAAGSFFYISMIEIIPTELNKLSGMRTKILAVFTGWMAMACIAFWA